jgi:uncharacterized protein YecE (DUF72 family)
MKKYIGCSGFYYNHWKGPFYPQDLSKSKWLPFYAEHFNTVELNNTFYRMPEEKAVKNWYAVTPARFIFAVKGYRFISHLKKLTVDAESLRSVEQFYRIAGLLKEKLGPVLWQLPGGFGVNIPRLEKFCSALSTEFQNVFEFRNVSWFTQGVFDVLEKYNAGLCIVSGPGKIPEVVRATSDFGYVRFHGKGSWYNDNYSNEDLDSWKTRLDALKLKELYAYFNNDINAYAINNGRYMASLWH